MNFLSSNIKFLRKQNNMNQNEFGKIVNKSRVLVSQWESDSREITTEDVIKISDYFQIPMDTLIGKDLRLYNATKNTEFETLFDNNKDILTDEDIEYIKFIIERRKKEYEENKKENK